MKKIITTLLMTLVPALGLAAGGGVHLDKADVDLHNQASLQNGAKLFVNYCLSCHSAAYMRYSRMGQDLGLSDEQVRDNLMFAADKKMVRQQNSGPHCNCAGPWCRLVIHLFTHILPRCITALGREQSDFQGRWYAACIVGTGRPETTGV